MTNMSSAISRIKLTRFTAFEKLDLRPSPGINVLVGANGTGKTHLMKVAYAACEARKPDVRFADKLARVFMPSQGRFGRLAKRRRGSYDAHAEVKWDRVFHRVSFSNHTMSPESAEVSSRRQPSVQPKSVYIPVKEMLANAPGFNSLYAERSIHFEEIYRDIIDRAYLPPLSGAPDGRRRKLLDRLRRHLKGTVTLKGEEFFLRAGRQGTIEFTLLAEGLRKFGLLWLLIQNGTLLEGSVLFWDEPETNLNPTLFGPVIEVLLELQRLGVQVFLATHDYVILKQLDLQTTEEDSVAYHVLYRDDNNGELACDTVHSYLEIEPNLITEVFGEIYNLEIRRSLGE